MLDTTLNLFRDPLRSLAIACWGLAVVLTVLLGWMAWVAVEDARHTAQHLAAHSGQIATAGTPHEHAH
jgi:hypothetical protein